MRSRQVRHGGLKTAAVVAFAAALVTGVLGAAPPAGAAVTASHITSPSNHAYYLNTLDTGGKTFAITGTSNGTTGDAVDIKCYDRGGSEDVVGNVALAANGSFSTTAPLTTVQAHECTLRAVPHGESPGDPSPYQGPTIAVSQAGSNTANGVKYDFYDWGQQLKGAYDYLSLSACGIDNGYLFDSTLNLTTTTFYCNAYLYDLNAVAATRSEIQVDGANAYGPEEAHRVNAAATGLPAVTVSQSLDKKTGDFVIHESDPFVKCADATYPPTTVTCTSFVKTGVTDHRTITQNTDGLVVWITDVFTSTDKKSHKLDLLWENDNHFHGTTGDSTQIEYKFPGHKSYALSTLTENVKLPAKPGTILLRMKGSADGDKNTGRGAIIYDTSSRNAVFAYDQSDWSGFELHQKTTVPAGGTKRFRFAYVQSYHQATVDKYAKLATAVFAGCTVPQVVGKTLGAAKKAIVRANCTVGKIRYAASSTIAKGVVVDQTPEAHTKVDYATKVALVVIKG
jgi:hypothetical protein